MIVYCYYQYVMSPATGEWTHVLQRGRQDHARLSQVSYKGVAMTHINKTKLYVKTKDSAPDNKKVLRQAKEAFTNARKVSQQTLSIIVFAINKKPWVVFDTPCILLLWHSMEYRFRGNTLYINIPLYLRALVRCDVVRCQGILV